MPARRGPSRHGRAGARADVRPRAPPADCRASDTGRVISRRDFGLGVAGRRAALALGAVAALAGCLAVIAAGALARTPARAHASVYVHDCPRGEEVRPGAAAASRPRASAALASHAGWPRDECLKIDKGPAGQSHTMLGDENVHNWLLGGYGNDTIFAGSRGDVIWADYHPSGQSESQVSRLHGGAGADWIYSSHGFNEIWTGAGNDHLALVYGHGVVHCDGAGLKTFVMRYLPQNRPWRLIACSHKVIDRYRA